MFLGLLMQQQKFRLVLCSLTLIHSFSQQIDESDMGTSDRKKTGHREITTHVSIHTIHLDGLRELYRHFLRLPDGAIVEVSKGSNIRCTWFVSCNSVLMSFKSG